jgi:hypothetical protein
MLRLQGAFGLGFEGQFVEGGESGFGLALLQSKFIFICFWCGLRRVSE